MEWSEFQLAIFENVAHGEGHTVVNAVAGAGKTTVLVEAAGLVPEGKSTLFVAFNKAIADDARGSVGGRAESGLDAPLVRAPDRHVGARAPADLQVPRRRHPAAVARGRGRDANVAAAPLRVVSLAKSALAHDAEAMDALVDAYGLELPGDMESVVRIPAGTDPRAWFVAEVVWLLERCRDGRRLPRLRRHGLAARRPQPASSASTTAVFVTRPRTSTRPRSRWPRPGEADGRIFAVGDRNQAIYQFRGADSRAFDEPWRGSGRRSCRSRSRYRCSRAVVAQARGKSRHPDQGGSGRGGGRGGHSSRASSMESSGRAAGRLHPLADERAAHRPLPELPAGGPAREHPGARRRREPRALREEERPRRVQALRDHVRSGREGVRPPRRQGARHASRRGPRGVPLELCDGARRRGRAHGSRALRGPESDDCIVLSSTHKAKGLERDRVWMLRDVPAGATGGGEFILRGLD